MIVLWLISFCCKLWVLVLNLFILIHGFIVLMLNTFGAELTPYLGGIRKKKSKRLKREDENCSLQELFRNQVTVLT